MFLEGLADSGDGAVATAVYEGTRPLLLEIQALTAPTNIGFARRSAIGIDNARLNMIIAVLERKAGLALINRDVYVNVTGGLRPEGTSADLACALAIWSNETGTPVPSSLLALGEIGLTGELRPVQHADNWFSRRSGWGSTRCCCLAQRRQLKRTNDSPTGGRNDRIRRPYRPAPGADSVRNRRSQAQAGKESRPYRFAGSEKFKRATGGAKWRRARACGFVGALRRHPRPRFPARARFKHTGRHGHAGFRRGDHGGSDGHRYERTRADGYRRTSIRFVFQYQHHAASRRRKTWSCARSPTTRWMSTECWPQSADGPGRSFLRR